MSSLRLALKQSLAESGQIIAEQKEKEKERRKKERAAQQRRRNEKLGKSKQRSRKKTRSRDSDLSSHLEGGGKSATIDVRGDAGGSVSKRSVSSPLSSTASSGSDSNSDGSSSSSGSSSNSSSGSSSGSSSSSGSNSDSGSSSSTSDDGMEMDGVFDAEVSSDEEGDTSSRKQERKERKEKKEAVQRARAHKANQKNAASKIQAQWKKKKPPENNSKKPVGSSRPRKEKRVDRRKYRSDDSSAPSNTNERERGTRGGGNSSTGGGSNKKAGEPRRKREQTVAPPSPTVIQLMRSISTGKMRRNITPGMRVKVRFTTKSKRDGKVTRRLKWYGGFVKDISPGGKRIRIKYDDGTSEVASFPDKDIVVDAEENGEHRVPADSFIPEPPSPMETQSSKNDDQWSHMTASEKGDDSRPQTNEDGNSPRPDKERRRQQKHFSREGDDDQSQYTGDFSERSPQSQTKPDAVQRNDSKSSTEGSNANRKWAYASPNASFDLGAPSPEQKMTKEIPSSEKSHSKSPLQKTDDSESLVDTGNDRQQTSTLDNNSQLDAHTNSRENMEISPLPNAELKEETSPNRESSSYGGQSFPKADNRVESQAEKREAELHSTKPGSPVTEKTGGMKVHTMKEVIPSDDMDGSGGKLSKRGSDVVAAEPGASESEISKTIGINTSPGRYIAENDEDVSTKSPTEKEVLSSRPMTGVDDNVGRSSGSISLMSIKYQSESYGTGKEDTNDHVSKKSHGTGKSRPTSPVASTLLDSISKIDNDGVRVESTSLIIEQGNVLSPKRTDSPASFSNTFKSVDSNMTKPLSVVAKGPSTNDGGDESSENASPVLSGSKTSAFVRQPGGAQALLSGKMNKELRLLTMNESSNSDGERPTLSPTALPDTKVSHIPTARSGRRAAQKANERIVAKQEIVIVDPYAKKKKKGEKHDLKLFPETPSHKKKRNRKRSEDEDDKTGWVQCERCLKWRLLPNLDDLPDHWFCELNTFDSKRNNCEAPEQTAEDDSKGNASAKAGSDDTESDTESITESTPNSKALKQPSSLSGTSTPGRRTPVDKKVSPNVERSLSKSPLSMESSDSDSDNTRTERVAVLAKVASASSSDSEEELPEEIPRGKKKPAVSDSTSKKPASGFADGAGGNGNENTSSIGANQQKPKSGSRNRKRARENQENDKAEKSSKSAKSSKAAENQEWVQCEKCEKWRRLPPRISAEDLPETWYCDMNSWDNYSSCAIAEEIVESGTRDVNILTGGNSPPALSSTGKLSYRSLIFGTGRKHNRPISERTRAAESLFANHSSDPDAGPPTVMYANSSAFVARGHSKNTNGGSTNISFLDIMSRSKLWSDLYGGSHTFFSAAGFNTVGDQYNTSYESLSDGIKQNLKALVHHAIGQSTLLGHEILLEVQCRDWGEAQLNFAEIRSICNLDLIMSVLSELMRDGLVEVLPGTGIGIDGQAQRYRKAPVPVPSHEGNQKNIREASVSKRSRCMKIAKPWKKARGADVGNE
eukprot:CAMPEP_0198288156 /NCGR_PEP_ID=MMETSP1449-20131203/6767_1 /TAXON_ID=420275 /ORGANISM="Attheya septentrionalis, Strain CCMP2084" /LENGTH=1494 /DNA_ID=CAMNT_0043986269 /DNA_START=203 /DNA_END=4687 /DNA_ORIENTATION=+